MGNARKPHPDQLALSQDPECLRREEDKQLVLLITHDQVVAYCVAHNLTVPSKGEWHNAQEVLTYFIRVRSSKGIFPSIKRIAAKAFWPEHKSEALVDRALRLLKSLGIITSERWGRHANRYTIHFDWMAEIRSAGASQASTSIRHSTHQTVAVDSSPRRIEVDEMTDRSQRNDVSAIKGINQEPTLNQPTTSDDGSNGDDWAVVEVEVSRCGVNQARLAVNVASSTPGMTPVCLRENLRHWRQHKAGWSHAAVVLFRRLLHIDPGISADEDWPPFDVFGYQAKLDLERLAIQNAEECRRHLDRRKKYQADRARCAAEWAEQPEPIDLRGAYERLMAEKAPDLARDIANKGKCYSKRYGRIYGPRPP